MLLTQERRPDQHAGITVTIGTFVTISIIDQITIASFVCWGVQESVMILIVAILMLIMVSMFMVTNLIMMISRIFDDDQHHEHDCDDDDVHEDDDHGHDHQDEHDDVRNHDDHHDPADDYEFPMVLIWCWLHASENLNFAVVV